jgi:hypothetical protein
MSIVDLLQLLCNNRRTWTVRLYGQGVDGDVVVLDGRLVDARWGMTHGRAALTEIVGCHYGYFELVPVESKLEHTLDDDTQSLLLNALHALDERNHELLKRANSTRPPTPRSQRPQAAVSGEHLLSAAVLTDLGFAALRNGSTEEAQRLWTLALRLEPTNRSLQYNLRKLERHETPVF